MNNEVKEIVKDDYHLVAIYKDNSVDVIKYFEPNILDYIINLQQENKDLKFQLKHTTHCYDEMEHSTLKNEVFYLQIENNLMKKQLSNINQHIDDAENKFKELMEILERFNNDNN